MGNENNEGNEKNDLWDDVEAGVYFDPVGACAYGRDQVLKREDDAQRRDDA